MAGPDPENAPELVEGPEAFDRFQQLAQQLVRAPKPEVDVAEAQETARKG